jgi:beta-1,4-mannosyltransferase
VKSIACIPDLASLAGNPYWEILRSSLVDAGITIAEEFKFQKKYIFRNRHKVQVLHFHYIQRFYEYEIKFARLDWVIRFGTNLILARILGYKIVYTLHNLVPTYELKPAWVDYLGHWLIITLADSVIVHCEKARELLNAKYRRKKKVYTVHHPNYINVQSIPFSKDEARQKLGLDNRHKVFCFFGGIRPNKGVERAIEAIKTLEGPELRLLITGMQFPPREYIQGLINQASLDDRIIINFTDDIYPTIVASDIVVLPFTRILTSGSLMLALSMGRPVIVPEMGCLPELVTKEVGWLYDDTQADGLVNVMREALAGDTEKMGGSAIERVKEFTGARMALETIRAYNRS